MVQPFVYTQPPVVEPYRHGLFDAAPVVPQPNTHWEYGGIEFESLACYLTQAYPGGLTDVNGSGGTKTLPVCFGVTQASAFSIFGGVATGSLGHTPEEWRERAVGIVELAGQHAVESALWTGQAGALPALNAAATPLVIAGQANTTAAAVDMVTAVALMEKYLGANYAGRGVIHAPRTAVAYMEWLQQIKHEDDRPEQLTTKLGTRFAFGAGYDGTGPSAVAPPAATTANQYFWMYVTGQVMLLKGDIVTPATFGEALNRSTNQVALLAEQPWLVAVDCLKAAILCKSPTIS